MKERVLPEGYIVQLYTEQEDCVKAAQLALDHHLYVYENWNLRRALIDTRLRLGSPFSSSIVAMVFDENNIPRSIVVLNLYNGNFAKVNAYTKWKYRRKGLASICIKKIQDAGFKIEIGDPGLRGARSFWYSNNIRYSGKA